MRIRIGPGGRVFSLVLVGLLVLTLVQGMAGSVQSAPKPAAADDDDEDDDDKTPSQCVVPTPPAFTATKHFVQIDVKPGDRRNRVNVKSGGTVRIAICSEDANGKPPQAPGEFNAPAQVVVICGPASSPSCRPRNVPSPIPPGLLPSTPTAGRTGFEFSLHSCNQVKDINGDGIPDLVCRFFIQKMNLNTASPSPTITLRGCCKTPEFEGTNAINCAVDCGPSFPPPPCIDC